MIRTTHLAEPRRQSTYSVSAVLYTLIVTLVTCVASSSITVKVRAAQVGLQDRVSSELPAPI